VGEIFVSYSRRDRQFADNLIQGLENSGLKVWVDSRSLEAGDSWRAEIAEAIGECDAFLIILSPNCIHSKNVVKELDIAEQQERHIIPMMAETCEIPKEMQYQLSGLQWIDFSQYGFDEGLERLVQTLHGGRKRGRAHAAEQPATGYSSPAPRPQTQSQPQYSFPTPQPTYAPPQLAQILCGRWNVQIMPAFGPPGQMMLEMAPNGAFNGQVMTPAGTATVMGGWQVTPVGQVVLQGQQTMGWVPAPYFVVVQFNQISPNELSGVTGNEQVRWQRMG
jgi:hypothetical protein